MDPEHESFFRQLKWLGHLGGGGLKVTPLKTKDGAGIIYSKELFYRGFGFRLRLFRNGSSGLI